MNMIDIVDWESLREANWQTLLLGNGASIALHNQFSYSTLHGVADAKGLLPTTVPIFVKIIAETGVDRILIQGYTCNRFVDEVSS